MFAAGLVGMPRGKPSTAMNLMPRAGWSVSVCVSVCVCGLGGQEVRCRGKPSTVGNEFDAQSKLGCLGPGGVDDQAQQDGDAEQPTHLGGRASCDSTCRPAGRSRHRD